MRFIPDRKFEKISISKIAIFMIEIRFGTLRQRVALRYIFKKLETGISVSVQVAAK